jgi:magnesium chelatase subunit H
VVAGGKKWCWGGGKTVVGSESDMGDGDPMRLLFERDLTPHPQYAAAYKWLQEVRVCGPMIQDCREL